MKLRGRQLCRGRPPERRRTIATCTALCLATLLGFFFTGCPGELENPERFGPVTCPAPMDVPTEIFAGSCVDALCHGTTEPAAQLDLASENVLDRLVDVPSNQCPEWLRIDSASPDESLLLHKLEEPFPQCGDRMPLGGSLTRVQIACVRDWILSAVGKGDGGLVDATSDAASAEASD